MSEPALTEAQVREIRRLYSAGGISQRVIVRRFGIAKVTIGDILTGRTWAHVAAA